ncbi:fumarylacetoacetate hydrolase family protein [Rhodococcus sp. OK302]|uniref:fumarylacetoacetate hydrolase family protein n=1 Tax=Rhodococcus sp. OK302 TaxID=1882769 RepID=UPI000B93BC4A|nr:fumarylacetoacetate hydrolase family protein [Rhodococcus sp. OK302]OYD61438.1 2-keto-4-pentenoate hydratase/2-oxohepta-3-ene-1,7-dioic acid hydratase in catechol pathway [Rhodococcus sp. OK302]
MRLCSFLSDGLTHVGVVDADDSVIDITRLSGSHTDDLPLTMSGWVELGINGIERLRQICEQNGSDHVVGKVGDLELVAPMGRLPRNVICVGVNYREHIEESERAVGEIEVPDVPVYFTKDVRSICGPFDDIASDDRISTQLDWEVELAVIIGRGGRGIRSVDALEHVFGYAVLNDVSARDVQLSRNQWWKGKSIEGSSPLGPFVVTRDEIPDPQDLELRCWVDGVEKQRSRTNLMIHDVAALISDLSRTLTLEPGDVISTGTPAGVGLARTPQEWLRPGSVLESEITGLGRQRNRIIELGE